MCVAEIFLSGGTLFEIFQKKVAKNLPKKIAKIPLFWSIFSENRKAQHFRAFGGETQLIEEGLKNIANLF